MYLTCKIWSKNRNLWLKKSYVIPRKLSFIFLNNVMISILGHKPLLSIQSVDFKKPTYTSPLSNMKVVDFSV